jgi:acetyl-CoA/propionyl-CoA carboxylase biotin carboxyl carrier protein
VVAVHAAEGDDLAANAVIVTLEAMKIEHAHALPVPGRVLELMVKPGDQVALRQPLARLEV